MPSDATILAHTRDWLERAVIGLSLCPFAKAVHTQKQIHYVVSGAQNPEDLLGDLRRELLSLMAIDPKVIDTTLIVHPHTLTDFLDFNDFLRCTDDLLAELELQNDIQIATFHPQYQFADSTADDIENYTNRAPYPTLQLLRQASVETSIRQYGDTAKIFQKNLQTLRRLGLAGWKKLGIHPF